MILGRGDSDLSWEIRDNDPGRGEILILGEETMISGEER